MKLVCCNGVATDITTVFFIFYLFYVLHREVRCLPVRVAVNFRDIEAF